MRKFKNATIFTCLAFLSIGLMASADVVKPVIVSQTNSVKCHKGDRAYLYAHVIGFPPPVVDILLMVQGDTYRVYTDYEYTDSQGNKHPKYNYSYADGKCELTINDVNLADVGEYIFTFYSRIGNAEAFIPLSLYQ